MHRNAAFQDTLFPDIRLKRSSSTGFDMTFANDIDMAVFYFGSGDWEDVEGRIICDQAGDWRLCVTLK